VLALRVTYVGELGWELYCRASSGCAVGHDLGRRAQPRLVAGGYKAVDSLRLEKGYRVWGADITSETDPYQAGLGFCVKLDKVISSAARRSSRNASRPPPPGWRASCSTTRGQSPLVQNRCASMRVVGRVTSGVTLHRREIDRVRIRPNDVRCRCGS